MKSTKKRTEHLNVAQKCSEMDSNDRVKELLTRGLAEVCKQVPDGSTESLEIQGKDIENGNVALAVGNEDSPQMRGDRRGARLDVGTFLMGVEISLRNDNPSLTEGLFGPLTNGKRENIYMCMYSV